VLSRHPGGAALAASTAYDLFWGVFMLHDFRHLLDNRELLWVWTLRSIKVRYKQSLLGGLWAILQPLALMVVFTVIFTLFVRIPTDGTPYPIFSYTALLPWTFSAGAIGIGVTSLVNNMNLVTKIYCPREIFPIAAVAASLLDLGVAAVVFAGMMIAYGIPLKLTAIVLPVLLLIQVLLTLGIVLFTAALDVFYRDIQFVVPLGIQLWMYATPIIYPLSVVPERFRPLYLLNPMAVLIESYRAVMLHGTWPDWPYLLVALATASVVFLIGYVFFKRVEWQFADLI
jgi:lipopolysaccharide transport system permease protein